MGARSRRGSRSRARLIGRASCFAALALAVQTAGAAPPPEQVEFEADQATIDPATKTVSLEGQVVVTCGRYELAADRLRLRASDGGVSVWGPGELTLCPCAVAPLRLAFDRARVETAGDVVVSEPALRIGDTTVLALPAMWLRSADQVGLLPPRLAWRGDGGLLAGPGVHLPWRESDGAVAWLDLYVSGYSRGGFEVEPTIVTETSWSRVRVDRMEGDLVRVVSSGTTRVASGGGGAWSADVSRGERARSGLVGIEEAAQRVDAVAARIDVRSFSDTLVGVGVEGIGPRGEPGFAWGPVLTADRGGGLGTVGTWSLGGTSRVLGVPGGASSQLSSVRGTLTVNGWAGPLSMGLQGATTAAGYVEPDATRADLAGWTNLRLGLPLSRRFSSGLVHRVEPHVLGTVLRARTDGAAGIVMGRPSALSDGTRWVASAGASTAIGRPGDPRGFELDVGGGGLGQPGEGSPSGLVRAEGVVRARWLALRGRGGAVMEGGRAGAVVVGRAQLGGARAAMVGGDVAVRTRVDPSAARALDPTDTLWRGTDSLDREGTSLGLHAGFPLIGGVRAEAIGHWDVGAERALSKGGGLAYEHPCGCLSLRSWLGDRVGREGVDGWLALELLPR